jgi:hypothetical protein
MDALLGLAGGARGQKGDARLFQEVPGAQNGSGPVSDGATAQQLVFEAGLVEAEKAAYLGGELR